ncbi:MAG: hypothetical protein H6721_04350 [Sandaracinus sp.]|nr:hypothetical protein [Myxococcales bacterium]MCB9631356.1 hypothetical protein [Sandaracinus sp.]
MKYSVPALGLVLTFASCVGTETGNPAVPTTLTLALHSTNPSVVSVRGDQGLVVEDAWIHIAEISFTSAAVCRAEDDDREVELPGPFFVELGDVAANLRDLLLRRSAYCGIEVDLERSPRQVPDVAPVELSRNTLVVRGRTAAGTPFVVVTQEEFELEIQSNDRPFSVDELSSRLVLSFDVARWFDGLDLDALTPGEGGRVHVTLFENEPTLRAFEANVEAAMELARDSNANGLLDDDDDVLLD